MADITVVAEAPRPIGSRASRRLRAAGKIPAVVYGHGREPIAIAVDGRALRAALSTESGINALLSLQIGKETHLTLARDIQRDPVRSTVAHVDFLIVRRDEVVTVDVPIVLVGEAHEVGKQDGLVEHPVTSLTVHATPDRIPARLEVDISQMEIGDTIRVGDIKLPAGVTTQVDPEEAVVVAARGTIELPEEEAEAEEGEEVEGAEREAGEGAQAAGTSGAEGSSGSAGAGGGGGAGTGGRGGDAAGGGAGGA